MTDDEIDFYNKARAYVRSLGDDNDQWRELVLMSEDLDLKDPKLHAQYEEARLAVLQAKVATRAADALLALLPARLADRALKDGTK